MAFFTNVSKVPLSLHRREGASSDASVTKRLDIPHPSYQDNNPGLYNARIPRPSRSPSLPKRSFAKLGSMAKSMSTKTSFVFQRKKKKAPKALKAQPMSVNITIPTIIVTNNSTEILDKIVSTNTEGHRGGPSNQGGAEETNGDVSIDTVSTNEMQTMFMKHSNEAFAQVYLDRRILSNLSDDELTLHHGFERAPQGSNKPLMTVEFRPTIQTVSRIITKPNTFSS
ncbi:hypothetical protein CPB86DRAFT_810067 [Serendipita vermifera]|nr:hypothetical protein CPB86DRAFT_810067 [Serendipita vermifera]